MRSPSFLSAGNPERVAFCPDLLLLCRFSRRSPALEACGRGGPAGRPPREVPLAATRRGLRRLDAGPSRPLVRRAGHERDGRASLLGGEVLVVEGAERKGLVDANAGDGAGRQVDEEV